VELVVTPLDYDGDSFKCPGTVTISLFEVQPGGTKKPISAWSYAPEALRGAWRSSLLGQGYHLVSGWDVRPQQKRLKAVAVFTTVDGRRYEHEKEFDVALEVKGPAKLPNRRLTPTPAAPAVPTSGLNAAALAPASAWAGELPDSVRTALDQLMEPLAREPAPLPAVTPPKPEIIELEPGPEDQPTAVPTPPAPQPGAKPKAEVIELDPEPASPALLPLSPVDVPKLAPPPPPSGK
jgi:hypothetical protein